MFTLRGRGIRASIDVLGPSVWIHVEGSVEEKWCREEGDEVLRMLRQLRQAHAKPDLYIITPFVMVADRLRQTIRESDVLKGWGGEDEWRWINERIGIVHTAPGREAEAVILVLGGSSPGTNWCAQLRWRTAEFVECGCDSREGSHVCRW